MEINGLPLHALAVHGAVVFGPLAALVAVAYAVPALRDRLRWPLLVVVAVALGSIWTAYLSGEQVEEANLYGGELAALVETHEERAEMVRLLMSALAVAAFLGVWQHARTGAVRWVFAALIAGLGVAAGVWTVLTGDTGAQIAWFGING
jgi:hypothetical protein